MAINVQYTPFAPLVGDAAYQAGLGEFRMREQQRLEDQRRFDEQMALRAAQFQADQQSREFQQGLAAAQFGEQQRGRNLSYLANLRGQNLGLLSDALGRQDRWNMFGAQADLTRERLAAGLAEAQMQQQGVQNRHQQAIAAQIESQRMAARLREMDAYRQAILKANLTPEQFDDVASQFEERFGESIFQVAPAEQQVDETDPVQQIAKAREQLEAMGLGKEIPLILDAQGNVKALWGPDKTMSFMEREHEMALELEGIKQAGKAKPDDTAEKEQERMQKAMDSFIKAADASYKEFLDSNPDTGATRFNAREYHKKLALLRQLYERMYGVDLPDTKVVGDEAPQTESPGEQQSGPPAWYLALPSGAIYTAPDGTQRVKP